MALAAQIWAYDVYAWINRILLFVCLGIELFALVNCALQRADAFPLVGRIPKIGWILILLLCVVLTGLLGVVSFIGYIAIIAALYYLLDVRRGLKDAVEGPGSW